MLDDFLIRSLLAGSLMVMVAAPMGCLMVWQRLAFLADTLGHASVLGIALALILSLQPVLGVLLVIAIIMFIVRLSSGDRPVAFSESVLAIISHTGLAGGILLLGVFGFGNISLEALMFGDLLATTVTDLVFIAGTVALLLALLWWRWHDFVAVSVSPEIAQAEGIAVKKVQLILYLMIALLIAVMMKIMGVLLIGAMLVIPVNAARNFSRGPEQMMWISLLFGALSLYSGVFFSWQFDWQTGPAIVVVAAAWLLVSIVAKKLNKALT